MYSAGSLTPVPTEVFLRDQIAAGDTPGPRMRAASFERDNNPVQMGPDGPRPRETGPDAVREFIAEQAAIGFDSVKLLLSNDDVFFEGGSMVTQYSPEEAAAAGEQARESGVWLNCHAQNPASIKLAVRSGFRSIYHCSYADAEAIDLLEEAKDSIFLSPAVGIMWANVHEGEEFGIDRAMAEHMGSVRSLEAMTALYPELRRRGLRVLPGGDYGFPNNPIGRNARDLELFVTLFGYPPLEVLRAATYYGGLVDRHAGGAADARVPRRHPRGQRLAYDGRHRAAGPGEPDGDHAGRAVPQAGRAAGARDRMTGISCHPDIEYAQIPGFRPLELDLYLPDPVARSSR